MIRRARPEDCANITHLIYQLAEYQKSREQCTVTPAQIEQALFGTNAAAFAHVAESDEGDVVGIAVWFRNFSTWDGTHGIYLEDLYVVPSARGHGHGKDLLATLAVECVDNNYTRLSWSVAKWNTPSIEFYESLGANAQTQWSTYRLADGPLRDLAATISHRNS